MAAAASAAAGRLMTATRRRAGAVHRLGTLPPEGRPLPLGSWRARHRAVLVLLWLHALALAPFGVASGYGLLHGVGEALPVAGAALLAAPSRLSRRWRSAIASAGLITASAVLV